MNYLVLIDLREKKMTNAQRCFSIVRVGSLSTLQHTRKNQWPSTSDLISNFFRNLLRLKNLKVEAGRELYQLCIINFAVSRSDSSSF